MSKIYLKGDVVWDKNHLPTEKEAMKLLGLYVDGEINPEAAVALSCGIDVLSNGLRFSVELDGERLNYGNA